MKLEDFVASIDKNTPEKIIAKISVEETDPKNGGYFTAESFAFSNSAWFCLEGAKVESIAIVKKAVVIIFSRGSHVYGLDWQDGFGATLCEYYPPEELTD